MNKVFLIGNLTRDPEMRSTQSGVPVCNFSIAVNRRFRNAQTGQQETDFLNIVAWRQLAELCGRYLTKGRKVAVTGSIQTRTYEAQDGSFWHRRRRGRVPFRQPEQRRPFRRLSPSPCRSRRAARAGSGLRPRRRRVHAGG